MNNRQSASRKCSHDVYIMGLCGNCGIRLDPPQQSSSVSMVHSLPGLRVSEKYAKDLGKEDQDRLIRERKLVLLVDLDQTLLHTTHEPVKDDHRFFSFRLWPGHPTYYTKLRPYLSEFLEQMTKIYELHIFTFGCRLYAHKIASIIDPEKKYFGNRILSRDESVDQYYKKGNLNNLFPCGDSMVCIIDDRADVWRDAGNLIQVKPYTYFKTSISDGAMLEQHSEDEEALDRDVDKLNALLGLTDDIEESDKKTEPTDSPNDVEEGSPSKRVKFSDEKEEQDTDDEETDEEKTDEDEIIDPDDHLKEYLPNILTRIHEKWYKKLDDETQFLVDSEQYKLPDIKDIIKTYLRKRN